MSDEQTIAVGQVWASKDGKRVVRVSRYDTYWDDVRWRHVNRSGGGQTYGEYLRRNYTLTEDTDRDD